MLLRNICTAPNYLSMLGQSFIQLSLETTFWLLVQSLGRSDTFHFWSLNNIVICHYSGELCSIGWFGFIKCHRNFEMFMLLFSCNKNIYIIYRCLKTIISLIWALILLFSYKSIQTHLYPDTDWNCFIL